MVGKREGERNNAAQINGCYFVSKNRWQCHIPRERERPGPMYNQLAKKVYICANVLPTSVSIYQYCTSKQVPRYEIASAGSVDRVTRFYVQVNLHTNQPTS